MLLFGTQSSGPLLAQDTSQVAQAFLADSLRIFCSGHYDAYNYFDALDCYHELLNEYESSNINEYYKIKVKLSWIYFNLGYANEAEKLVQEAMDHFKDKDRTLYIGAALNQVWFLLDQNEFESGRTILKSIGRRSLRSALDDDIIKHHILNSRLMDFDGDSLTAKKDLESATSLCLRKDNPHWYCYVQYFMGQHWYGKKRAVEATKAFHKASKVAKQLNNDFLYKQTLDKLIPILGSKGSYDQAYQLLIERKTLSDSLNALQRQALISKQIIKYESQKKQKEIIDLEGEKRLNELKSRRSNLANYALMIAFLAVLVAAYLIIMFYQQKLSSNQIIALQKEQITQQRITELNKNLQIESMQSMMKGQESERERVAKDLHDSLGGMLSAIKLRFDGLTADKETIDPSELSNIHGLLDDACQEVRNISSNLQPGALEQLGLIEALNDLINKYERGSKTEIHFQHYGIIGQNKFETFTSLNIYRIIQELLNNSLKHSQASEILIQLQRDDGQIVVMVEDDGKGYDPKIIKEGMGSENVRSRVTFLNGELSINSNVGEGTSTMIIIPVAD
jgi:signal transduction histidine kinase